MKRSWWIATAMVTAAGAVRVGAGGTANLEGSDTLFDFASAVLAGCPGTVGPYLGEARGDGESAMIAGTQAVAPMSSFLDGAACSGAAAAPNRSQGLVLGFDGVAVLGANATMGAPACNGDPNLSCLATFEPLTGAAYDTTILAADGTPYTFDGWRDVLRVLLAGLDHDHVGTGPEAWAARDCLSPARRALANGYGAFFENDCGALSGEAVLDANFSPVCTELRHVFRLGDFSAATETMAALLGLPAIVHPETLVVSDVGGAASTITQHTGASIFCNAVRPAFVFPRPQPTTLQGTVDDPVDATWDPTSTEAAANGLETAVYRAVFQDNDPVRRLCAGTGTGTSAAPAEDVCSHSGDLGLVLPINDVQELAPHGNADRYNATPCSRSKIASVSPPDVYDAITQQKITCGLHGLACPNGDLCNNFGGCFAPADPSGSPQCLASRLSTPALTSATFFLPVANPRPAFINDGRSYNQHLYVLVGAAGGYQTQAPYQVGNGANGFPVTGAYYRIHTSHSLSPANPPPTCQRSDMSEQVACLVAASPCSLGYAGRGALSAGVGVTAIKVNRQSPELACIQGHLLYPLSRKLYFDSVPGFAAVSGQELQLTGCMTDRAEPLLSPPTPAGLVSAAVAAAGFVPIPPFVNGGAPFCEDFDEQSLCGTLQNADACKNVPPALTNFPSFETVCGDGLQDPYEDCDDGLLNGPPPAACSSTCRRNR